MEKHIGLVHATLNAVQPMIEAFRHYEPSVKVIHFLDEGLLAAVNEQKGVTPQILRRFVALLERAAEAKVDGILLSCSVFSPYVPLVSHFFTVPIVSVDRDMLEQAVSAGEKIGVIATVAAAGPTTAQQIEKIARSRGKKVQVHVALCPKAFAKLQSDPEGHDRLIRENAAALAADVDVIVLAQISMARATSGMTDIGVPVLTSPEISIEAMMKKLSREG